MKPNPSEEARRWLSQAAHTLEVARKLLHDAYDADSCFYAEQAAQLALKAFLMRQGERFVSIHSVKALIERSARYDDGFRAMGNAGRVLDQYYIPTRYPDALADPAVPFESYTHEQAVEAVRYATQLYDAVQQRVGS